MGEKGEFSESDFEKCFQEFDKDGNGTISKDEMKTFIKKVAGLWEHCNKTDAHKQWL